MKKIDLNIPEVAVREIRLGSITEFHGNAETLVKNSCRGKMCDKGRSFSQCLDCSISKATCMVALIQDAAVICHGPVGCASCLHEFAFTYRVNAPLRNVANPTQRRIFSTNISEKDTVYGGTEKLAAAIRQVHNRTQANVIFVLSTCATGIIGDDIESVVNDAEAELSIPIVAIFCEGFRSTVWTSGFDAGYHGIARKLIKPAQEHKKDMINVINFWGSDIFSEWLAVLGAKPNYITPYSTVEILSHSSEAIATIQACQTLGSYLGAALEQEFGVTEIKTPPPYGIAQTDRWFRELGKLLGKEKEVEQLIAEKKAVYLPKIEQLRTKLRGKTAYVTAGAAHGHALLSVLRELGLRVIGAAIFHHDPIYDSNTEVSDGLAQSIRDYGDVPNYDVCDKQEFELVNMLNHLHPDVLLARHGGMTLWGAKFGIPSLLIGDEHFSMGYEGIVKYGERLIEVMENDEFVKNLAQHSINPYTKWWLKQSPYKFLKGGEGCQR
ncbi:nitrogenase component 1 [Pectinatus frisingensis]|uniref:nitrogenase component 1 n=1 Tax=Pectinatus frisingensis TaxID=865 RepID=UPI0018C56E7B|nr:nitrogenase component 1 [Pectinatus frisingensis]